MLEERKRGKEVKILCFIALALVLMVGITPALAYFTTRVSANGGYTIDLTSTTSIDEEFSDWEKRITVTNTKGEPVFVRARAYAGSAITLVYSGEGWKAGEDGWYYYDSALSEGQSTETPLCVQIQNIPEAADKASFNVAVVYESTPVQYKADGTAYADWTMTLDIGGKGE